MDEAVALKERLRAPGCMVAGGGGLVAALICVVVPMDPEAERVRFLLAAWCTLPGALVARIALGVVRQVLFGAHSLSGRNLIVLLASLIAATSLAVLLIAGAAWDPGSPRFLTGVTVGAGIGWIIGVACWSESRAAYVYRLRSSNPAMRVRAAQWFGQVPGRVAPGSNLAPLFAALDDAEPAVRLGAVDALSRCVDRLGDADRRRFVRVAEEARAWDRQQRELERAAEAKHQLDAATGRLKEAAERVAQEAERTRAALAGEDELTRTIARVRELVSSEASEMLDAKAEDVSRTVFWADPQSLFQSTLPALCVTCGRGDQPGMKVHRLHAWERGSSAKADIHQCAACERGGEPLPTLTLMTLSKVHPDYKRAFIYLNWRPAPKPRDESPEADA